MRLSPFMEQNIDRLIAECETGAGDLDRSTAPPGGERCYGWARELLRAIAAEMAAPPSTPAREPRSARLALNLVRHSQAHATECFRRGVELEHLIAEYRDLKSSVLRHWTQNRASSDGDVGDLVRFTEIVDDCLAESIRVFAAKSEQLRDLFVAGLGHDLRNPLSAMSFSAELLLMRKSRLEREEAHAVAHIASCIDHLQRMIGDCLDFTGARLPGTFSLHLEPVGMAAACRTAIDRLAPLAGAYPLTLNATGNPRGTWDRRRIEQALTTVISAAIDCCEEPGPIAVGVEEVGGEVRATISSGGAFSDEARRALLEPRSIGPDEMLHAGLALHVAKQIVDAHGGNLEITSHRGRGTTFAVCLPGSPPS